MSRHYSLIYISTYIYSYIAGASGRSIGMGCQGSLGTLTQLYSTLRDGIQPADGIAIDVPVDRNSSP